MGSNSRAGMPTKVPLDQFNQHFSDVIELSSDCLGGSIVAVSDEWFAPAKSLLQQHPAQNLAGQYGPNGALYDGWESRRHNPNYDWVIIKLGVPNATIIGFDIDTTYFNGNESPASSVYGLNRLDPPPTSENDQGWVELLPVVSLSPSSRHLFRIQSTSEGYRYLKLHMIPDGGIARFRVYGSPIPSFPSERFDLASILFGGQIVNASDQHYGNPSNLLLPGRGPDNMGGGWETKRSRKPGHSEFVIIKLGHKGYLDYVEVDTNYFIGNFPQEVDVYGTTTDEKIPSPGSKWIEILTKNRLGPHQQHYFQLLKPDQMFTHVKMTIYPDGGVKRVRLMGRISPSSETLETLPKDICANQIDMNVSQNVAKKKKLELPVLPLTASGFGPYGSVIQAFSDSRAYDPKLNKKLVNFGTAIKYENIMKVENLNRSIESPSDLKVNLFSCEDWKLNDKQDGKEFRLKLKGLERHEFSSQTFIPLISHSDNRIDSKRDQGLYLIVVALDDGQGKPNIQSLRAFIGRKSQGISYSANIWHAPLIAIKQHMDFFCLIYESGNDKMDCELIQLDEDDSQDSGIFVVLDRHLSELMGIKANLDNLNKSKM